MAFYNPTRQAYIDDPYPSLARLREEEPVYWSAEMGAWVVTSYAECLRLFMEEKNFSSDPANASGEFGEGIARRRAEVPMGNAPILGNSDAPAHTRLRGVVNRAFTPRAIEGMRPVVEEMVEGLLGDAEAGKPFEVMSRLAEPLVVATVLEHLGVPRPGWGLVREWSTAIMRARAEGGEDPRVVRAAMDARGEMLDYMAKAYDEGEIPERPSVLRTLMEAVDAEEEVEPEELLMLLIHISLAGNGPTALAVGNIVATLARHPEQRAALLADPAVIPAAVEELLRFEGPTHAIARFVLKDTQLGARTVRAGQQVYALVSAANRDPAQFPDPDTFDIARQPNRHLSLGMGVHVCLGAPLARLELEVLTRQLLQRFGAYELLNYQAGGTFLLRGPGRLIIRPA